MSEVKKEGLSSEKGRFEFGSTFASIKKGRFEFEKPTYSQGNKKVQVRDCIRHRRFEFEIRRFEFDRRSKRKV